MPDHSHLLLDCRPQFKISDMVKIMKGNTARWLFLKRPELKKSLWGGHLWNPSYCAVTVSDRSREQVESYIRNQKEHERCPSAGTADDRTEDLCGGSGDQYPCGLFGDGQGRYCPCEKVY